MNVLILVSGGDVETLQASALLQALSQGLPDLNLTLACPPDSSELASHLPGPTSVIPLHCGADTWTPVGWLQDFVRIRRGRFDAAFICSKRARLHWLAYLNGTPRRLGQSGGLSGWMLSDGVSAVDDQSPAVIWLETVRALGLTTEGITPHFVAGEQAEQTGTAELHSTGFADGRLLVAIAPSRGVRGKRAGNWDPERWAHVANQLGTRHGAAVVFLGPEADEKYIGTITADVASPHADLSPADLDLPQTAAVIAQCDLLLSSNPTLLQLAACVGTPTVGLFGEYSGHELAPAGSIHRVIQAIGKRQIPPKLDSIRIEDVLAAVEMTE